MSKSAIAPTGSALSFIVRCVCLVLFGSALLLAAGCAQEKRVEEKSQPKAEPSAAAAAPSPSVQAFEDREGTIMKNPCKGEQPGNVLGISEQLETPRKVAAFIEKLNEPEPKVRACAARQLGYLKTDARAALPQLIKLVRDEKEYGVWVNVSNALWEVGPVTRADVSELLESARNDDVYIRLYAAFALGYQRPPVSREKEVVAALMSTAKDQDGTVRWMAVRGLGQLGSASRDAVPFLIEILVDKKNKLRGDAAIALGRIGPEAAESVPVLLKTLYGADDDYLYFSVAMALAHFGPSLLPVLEKELKGGHALPVLEVVSYMGPGGAPLVIKALGMRDKQVRQKAIKIIQQLGPAAEQAVPLLIKALRDGDAGIRMDAATALKNLGTAAQPAVPALTAALHDKYEMTLCAAARALGAIGPEAMSAVPELQRLMNLPAGRGSDLARHCAAEGLMTMSPETKALVSAETVKEVEEWNARGLATVRLPERDETMPKHLETKKPELGY